MHQVEYWRDARYGCRNRLLPVVLIALTVVSLISLAAVEVLLWANPFQSGPTLYVAGRTLWIRAELPRLQPYVLYNAPSTAGDVGQWAIFPRWSGH